MTEARVPGTIPVLIVTGFLGSGKTTLLNTLLRQDDMAGTLAIINEFGEIGLDHLLVEVTSDRLALLDNGCVCCTVREDLVQTLIEMEGRRDEPGMPEINRVVLETTGLADPAPILHALMAQPELEDRFHIEGVITLVDAVNGADTLDKYEEARRQLAVADLAVLTKNDIAGSEAIDAARASVARINPSAKVIAWNGETTEAAMFLQAGTFTRSDRAENYTEWAQNFEEIAVQNNAHDHACVDPDCSHDHQHSHTQKGGISTYAFTIDTPVDWGRFREWLEYLATLKGANLLRMKGLVQIAEDLDHPMVLHGVQHVFHRPRRLDRWPSEDRRTRLVFIVKEIPREIIERTLIKFAAINPGEVRGVAAA